VQLPPSIAASLARAHSEHAELLAELSRADGAWAAGAADTVGLAWHGSFPVDLQRCADRLVAHLADEERLVYPHLADCLPLESGALEAALDEHATLRNLLTLLQQWTASPTSVASDDAAAIGATLRDLLDLWRMHAHRVDDVIGPLLAELEARR
jgi:hypothetical protein